MTEPIKVKVLRAWDKSIVTAHWDIEKGQLEPWLVIRHTKSREGDYPTETTVRLSRREALELSKLIERGDNG